jgi:hypothetical protein
MDKLKEFIKQLAREILAEDPTGRRGWRIAC